MPIRSNIPKWLEVSQWTQTLSDSFRGVFLQIFTGKRGRLCACGVSTRCPIEFLVKTRSFFEEIDGPVSCGRDKSLPCKFQFRGWLSISIQLDSEGEFIGGIATIAFAAQAVR